MNWSEQELQQAQGGGKSVNYANRGKDFEKMIEATNEQYRRRGIALIEKFPEPYKQISKMQKNGTFQAVRDSKSMPDFVGVCEGEPLLFDAKSTKVETRFDLSNIAEHQYNSLKKWHEQGGISFLVIYFKSHGKIYYLPFESLRYWTEEADRKSIPYESFEYEITANGLLTVDYLEIMKDLEGIE